MKTIRDFELKDKTVIIRCDFNVPIKDGIITDDNRIKESLMTIQYALKEGAKVVLLSHLGRIESEADKVRNTLLPVAKRLEVLLNQPVIFIASPNGNKMIIEQMKSGEVALIENTRHQDYPLKLESGNNIELAKRWAMLGDIFINDAFGAIHRAHASTVGIAQIIPSGIGFLVEKEVKKLAYINNPKKPFIVILGGAKVKDKMPLIDNIIFKADYILVGGGIANTFIKAMNIEVGGSLVDEENLKFCRQLLDRDFHKIVKPLDFKVATSLEDPNPIICDYNKVPENMNIYDIGPQTVALYADYLKKAHTIVWNGTMGVSEHQNYQEGTYQIAKLLSELEAIVIIGGGDTAGAVIEMGFKDSYTHISTGGGAAIELLEGKELPGLAAIDQCE